MANTTNLNLKKPSLDDDALIADINDNMDKVDAAVQAGSEAIAIVSLGNTHGAIDAGQYVYVRGHNSLAEGLYTANSAIAANATLSSSNVTAVSGGGLNALNSKIATSDSISTGITGLSIAWKVAGIAFIKVYDLKPSANGTIGTLPTALRPKQGFNFPVTQLAGNVVAMLGISTNGEVSASGFDTSKYYYGIMVYPVA